MLEKWDIYSADQRERGMRERDEVLLLSHIYCNAIFENFDDGIWASGQMKMVYFEVVKA